MGLHVSVCGTHGEQHDGQCFYVRHSHRDWLNNRLPITSFVIDYSQFGVKSLPKPLPIYRQLKLCEESTVLLKLKSKYLKSGHITKWRQQYQEILIIANIFSFCGMHIFFIFALKQLYFVFYLRIVHSFIYFVCTQLFEECVAWHVHIYIYIDKRFTGGKAVIYQFLLPRMSP